MLITLQPRKSKSPTPLLHRQPHIQCSQTICVTLASTMIIAKIKEMPQSYYCTTYHATSCVQWFIKIDTHLSLWHNVKKLLSFEFKAITITCRFYVFYLNQIWCISWYMAYQKLFSGEALLFQINHLRLYHFVLKKKKATKQSSGNSSCFWLFHSQLLNKCMLLNSQTLINK